MNFINAIRENIFKYVSNDFSTFLNNIYNSIINKTNETTIAKYQKEEAFTTIF